MDSIVGDTQGAVLYHWPTYVQLMCKRFEVTVSRSINPRPTVAMWVQL